MTYLLKNEPLSIFKAENNTLFSLGSTYTAAIASYGFGETHGVTIDLKDTATGIFDTDLLKMQAVDTYPIISASTSASGGYIFEPGDYKIKYHISYLMRNGDVVPNYYAANPNLVALYTNPSVFNVLNYDYQKATTSGSTNLEFFVIADIRVLPGNIYGLGIAVNWGSYYTYFQGVNSWKAEIQKFTDGSL